MNPRPLLQPTAVAASTDTNDRSKSRFMAVISAQALAIGKTKAELWVAQLYIAAVDVQMQRRIFSTSAGGKNYHAALSVCYVFATGGFRDRPYSMHT